jgi:hypothetical protein
MVGITRARGVDDVGEAQVAIVKASTQISLAAL